MKLASQPRMDELAVGLKVTVQRGGTIRTLADYRLPQGTMLRVGDTVMVEVQGPRQRPR